MEAERTDPNKERPIQFNAGLPQPAYALLPYMLTQVIYRERKKLSFDIGTKTHLLEFSTFSRLPSVRFSCIEACETLSWVIIYYKMIHEVQNQMKLSTSDRMTFTLFDCVTNSAVFTRP